MYSKCSQTVEPDTTSGADLHQHAEITDSETRFVTSSLSPQQRLQRCQIRDEAGNWKKKYQRENHLLYLLPQPETVERETEEYFHKLLSDMAKCVLARDFNLGLTIVLSSFTQYMTSVGARFTKEQHILLVNLLIELLTLETMPFEPMTNINGLLQLLLEQTHLLTRDDLTIPWKPLYLTYRKCRKHHSPNSVTKCLQQSLKVTISRAKFYFHQASFAEILEEFKPHLYPGDNREMRFGLNMLSYFLPFENSDCNSEIAELMEFLLGFFKSWNPHALWEKELINVLAKGAASLHGEFDWNPHIPELFARFRRDLNLPVSFSSNNIQCTLSSGSVKINPSVIATFVVALISDPGSKETTLTCLKAFLRSLEAFYNPANSGEWTRSLTKVLVDLVDTFYRRVQSERYRSKCIWWDKRPQNNLLTDSDIDIFVSTMSQLVLKFYLRAEAGGSSLRQLGLLRPHMVIPPVMEKYFNLVDSLTESEKYLTTMDWVITIAPMMISSRKEVNGYDGRENVIPLLQSLLPAIDSNDMDKTCRAVEILSIVFSKITVVDSSSCAPNIYDETQRELCFATQEFPDFVLVLLDKVLRLIENSSHQVTRMIDIATPPEAAPEDSALPSAVWHVFRPLAMNSSTKIAELAINKIVDYALSRTLEADVSGKIFTRLCQAFAVSRPDILCPKLLPRLCHLIQSSLQENISDLDNEDLDKSLHFYMLLFRHVLETAGTELLNYKGEINSTVKSLLQLNGKKASRLAAQILTILLASLVLVYPLENRISEANLDDPNYLSTDDWGASCHWKDTHIKWHFPSQEEMNWAKETFLSYFTEYAMYFDGISSLTQPDLKLNKVMLKSMNILQALYFGISTVLPRVDEPLVQVKDCAIDFTAGTQYCKISKVDIKFPGTGEHIKLKYFQILEDVYAYLEKLKPDDIEAYLKVANGIEACIFCPSPSGYRFVELDTTHGNEFSLDPSKRYTRSATIIQAYNQHLQGPPSIRCCTVTQLRMLNCMFSLCVHRYAEVRSFAQHIFNSYIDGSDDLVSRLTSDIISAKLLPGVSHDEYKGALYVLASSKRSPLLINSWAGICTTWLGILRSPFSEKNSIINLMDELQDRIRSEFVLLQLHGIVSVDSFIDELAKSLTLKKDSVKFLVSSPSPVRKEIFMENRKYFNQLVSGLLELGHRSSQHWRKQLLCMHMLFALINTEMLLDVEVVEYFWEGMVSKNAEIQNTALTMLKCLANVFKRKYELIQLDAKILLEVTAGIPIQSLLQYNGNVDDFENKLCSIINASSLDFNQAQPFLEFHKDYSGYTALPKKLKFKICPQDFQNHDDQPESVRNFLSVSLRYVENQDYLKELLNLWRIDDDLSLHSARSTLAKLITRNHGPNTIRLMTDKLSKIRDDPDQWNQICIAHILGGFMAGIKLWDKGTIESFWREFQPALAGHLDEVTQETFPYWATVTVAMLDNRNANKMRFFIEFMQRRLMESLESAQSTSVDASQYLTIFDAMSINLGWRGGCLFLHLLEALENYVLDTPSPFQAVRKKLGSILSRIYTWYADFPHAKPEQCNSDCCAEFLARVRNSLSNIIEISEPYKADDESEDNVRIGLDLLKLKTVLEWIKSVFMSKSRMEYKFYAFIPWFCHFESFEPDPEIAELSGTALYYLSKSLVQPEHMTSFLGILCQIAASPYWKSRQSLLDFLSYFCESNYSIIASNSSWSATIVNLVMSLLIGERRIEIREFASQVLSGLIYYGFVEEPLELVEKFKCLTDKFKTKRKRLILSNDKVRHRNSSEEIDGAHAGILGLCAVVNANVYDVPVYLPEILVLLANLLNLPPPIPEKIRKCLSDFRQTHQEDWEMHKLLFAEEQLRVLNDVFVSPCYYA